MPTPGRVASIRLSPRDCMRMVDTLKRMGTDPAKMNGTLSFSHAVKLVLEGCLYALERDGLIPNRTGFEYLELMAVFPVRDDAVRARGQQVSFTKQSSTESHTPTAPTEESYETKQARVRLEELQFKAQQDPDNFDAADFKELEELQARLP